MCNSDCRESGDLAGALAHLETHKAGILDRVQWLELAGTYNLILERFSAAVHIYEELLRRNAECGQYYDHLIISKQLSQGSFNYNQRTSFQT